MDPFNKLPCFWCILKNDSLSFVVVPEYVKKHLQRFGNLSFDKLSLYNLMHISDSTQARADLSEFFRTKSFTSIQLSCRIKHPFSASSDMVSIGRRGSIPIDLNSTEKEYSRKFSLPFQTSTSNSFSDPDLNEKHGSPKPRIGRKLADLLNGSPSLDDSDIKPFNIENALLNHAPSNSHPSEYLHANMAFYIISNDLVLVLCHLVHNSPTDCECKNQSLSSTDQSNLMNLTNYDYKNDHLGNKSALLEPPSTNPSTNTKATATANNNSTLINSRHMQIYTKKDATFLSACPRSVFNWAIHSSSYQPLINNRSQFDSVFATKSSKDISSLEVGLGTQTNTLLEINFLHPHPDKINQKLPSATPGQPDLNAIAFNWGNHLFLILQLSVLPSEPLSSQPQYQHQNQYQSDHQLPRQLQHQYQNYDPPVSSRYSSVHFGKRSNSLQIDSHFTRLNNNAQHFPSSSSRNKFNSISEYNDQFYKKYNIKNVKDSDSNGHFNPKTIPNSDTTLFTAGKSLVYRKPSSDMFSYHHDEKADTSYPRKHRFEDHADGDYVRSKPIMDDRIAGMEFQLSTSKLHRLRLEEQPGSAQSPYNLQLPPQNLDQYHGQNLPASKYHKKYSIPGAQGPHMIDRRFSQPAYILENYKSSTIPYSYSTPVIQGSNIFRQQSASHVDPNAPKDYYEENRPKGVAYLNNTVPETHGGMTKFQNPHMANMPGFHSRETPPSQNYRRNSSTLPYSMHTSYYSRFLPLRYSTAEPYNRSYSKKKVTSECHSCGITSSPEWRKGPNGHKTLCNACGLRYSRSLKKMSKNLN